MTVAVTEQAAGHVQRQLEARGRGEGIRIAVKTRLFRLADKNFLA